MTTPADGGAQAFAAFGVDSVINAAGKLTALGGSVQTAAVVAAAGEAAGSHVDMQQLRAAAGAEIATHTGAAAASVTTGAAAGIAIAVAACITGEDITAVQALPDADGRRNRVFLQAGHAVDFGASVTQMIRLGGGCPHVLGATNLMRAELLRHAVRDHGDVAAFLFVQSHHSVQANMLSLAACIDICHQASVPVIVDAAAESDLRRYVAAGADLVIYSGGKAIGGPTSGFIAGSRALVAACELQQYGIGRTMKVGKEQIAGLLTALRAQAVRDPQADAALQRAVLQCIADGAGSLPGLEVSWRADEAGRDIERLAVRTRDGRDVRDLVRFLVAGSPSIRTRNHHLDEGFVLFDARELTLAQATIIAARLRAFSLAPTPEAADGRS